MSTGGREALPEGWCWDSDDGPWACHAIGPNGCGATVHKDFSLGTSGRVPREVVAACWRRADRLFGRVPASRRSPTWLAP